MFTKTKIITAQRKEDKVMTLAFKQSDQQQMRERKKKGGIQTKEFYSSKDPRCNLRPLATTTEDVLHVHNGHDGSYSGDEATN
jgi:hypothetical protein